MRLPRTAAASTASVGKMIVNSKIDLRFLVMEFVISDFENVNIELKDFIDFVLQEKADNNVSTQVIPTGLNRLDKMLNGGFRRGDLCFIAARAYIEKTYLALQLANNISKTGKKVLYFADYLYYYLLQYLLFDWLVS